MKVRMDRIVVMALTVMLCAGGAWAQPAADAKLKTRLAWQIALDRAGFSPGLIDGAPGRKTSLGLWEYQRANGLPVTARPEPAAAAALGVDPDKALTTYTVTAADLEQIGGPLPKKWQEKARLKRMSYETLDAMLAEKFHSTRALMAELNGGRDMNALKAGDTITVPNVIAGTPAQGDRIEINFAEKVVRIYAGTRLVGMFHCSIAADKDNLPSVTRSSVAVISDNPTYRFDPAKWPEVKDVDEILMIPPGPRNPVGLCWVGLTLSGYGIHGTPTPEMIGKTGSHGCFRLANWDAQRLGKMVKVGTPVLFLNQANDAFTKADDAASKAAASEVVPTAVPSPAPAGPAPAASPAPTAATTAKPAATAAPKHAGGGFD